MSDSIALGSRRFEIRPLRLGQLRHLLDALEEMAGKSGGGLIEAAARVVAVGVAPAHPDTTADMVLDLEAGVDELNMAVAAILRVAGLRPQESDPKEPGPGEAPSPGRPAAEGGRSGDGEPESTPREQLVALYGALATGCGYSYRVIDRMTLAEAGEIFAYWEHNPPAHLMMQTIARMLGWSPLPAPASAAQVEQIAASPPLGLAVARGGTLDMPPPLDLDALRARNRARGAAMLRRDLDG